MRRVLVLLVLAFLLAPASAALAKHMPEAGHVAPPLDPAQQTPECAAQQASMAAIGRPSAQARLLGSSQQVAATPVPAPSALPAEVYVVRAGDTLSQIATRHAVSLYALATANNISNINLIYVGQRLTIPGATMVPGPSASSAPLAAIDSVWSDGEAVQGETVLIWVRAASGSSVSGRFGEQTIPFHPRCGLYWGLVAFDALLDEPGVQQLDLTATASDGRRVVVRASIPLKAGTFWAGPPVQFPADKQRLLERDVIDGENRWLATLFANNTNPYSAPRWSGRFQLPINSVVTGSFGSRGVVNGKPTGYHEGIDFRGAVGTPFYAPAPGTVVLAEPLTVRGGALFLDHGAGVMSGFFHMSNFAVEPGDTVQSGDLLGWVGGSGLTTGPHLHWEVRVNNRWVNPSTWLTRTFP